MTVSERKGNSGLAQEVCLEETGMNTLDVVEDRNGNAGGCYMRDEREDCLCRWCYSFYRVGRFYVDVNVRKEVKAEDVVTAARKVVKETSVWEDVEKGSHVEAIGYYEMVRPEVRHVAMLFWMEAECVGTQLVEELGKELARLEADGTVRGIMVDVSGYGLAGNMLSPGAGQKWIEYSVERAWPRELSKQAVRVEYKDGKLLEAYFEVDSQVDDEVERLVERLSIERRQNRGGVGRQMKKTGWCR
ncbi:hypothetical protein MAJ_11512, partial [Metarhizium majus ARSEF 297]